MKNMTHNTQALIATERERWLRLHLEGRMSITMLSERSGFSRDTLHRWKKQYLTHGLAGLQEKSRAHRSHPNTTQQEVVERIHSIREEAGFCAAKIRFRLLKQGVVMSTRGIHRVLKREGMVRTKRRFPRKDIWKPRATVLGEVVEIDVAYMRRYKGRWLYQFTAVDSCTRWRFLNIYQEQHIGNARETFFKNSCRKPRSPSKASKQTMEPSLPTDTMGTTRAREHSLACTLLPESA
ncbi:MAG: helix-turn-helix domain-containing protein [bacterium]|nr:helix-turn-helix domain-containing protein [bacterium]